MELPHQLQQQSSAPSFAFETIVKKPLVSFLITSSTLEMAFPTINSGFSLFPASPASLNPFGILTHAQSPRDNHVVYEEFRQVLGSTNGRPSQKQRGSGSLTGGLKKAFGSV